MMTTNRPLARLGIADLEDIFEKQGEDLTVLARLKNELSHRQVPRALALQDKIRKVEMNRMKGAAPAKLSPLATEEPLKIPSVSTEQLDLLGAASKSDDTSRKETAPAPNGSTPIEPQPLPQLALDDACKILKVGINDAWEKVEIARRKAIQKSNPVATRGMTAAQIEKLLSEAKLANDAAIVIAARLSGRQ